MNCEIICLTLFLIIQSVYCGRDACLSWRWAHPYDYYNYFVDGHTNPELFKPKDASINNTNNAVIWSTTIKPKAAGVREFCFDLGKITDYFILHLNYITQDKEENHRYFRVPKSDLLKSNAGSLYYDSVKKELDITNHQNKPVIKKIKAIELNEATDADSFNDDQGQILSIEMDSVEYDDRDTVMTDAGATPQQQNPSTVQSPGVGRAPPPTPPPVASRAGSVSPPLGSNEKMFTKKCKLGTRFVAFNITMDLSDYKPATDNDKKLNNNNIRLKRNFDKDSDTNDLEFIINEKAIDRNSFAVVRVSYTKNNESPQLCFFALPIHALMNDAYTYLDLTFTQTTIKHQILLESTPESTQSTPAPIEINEIEQSIPNVFVKELNVLIDTKKGGYTFKIPTMDTNLMNYKPVDKNLLMNTIGTTYIINNHWENDPKMQQLTFEFCDKTPETIIMRVTNRTSLDQYFSVKKSMIISNTTTIEFDVNAPEKLTFIDKAKSNQRTVLQKIPQQILKHSIDRQPISIEKKTLTLVFPNSNIISSHADDYLNYLFAYDRKLYELPYNMDVEIKSTTLNNDNDKREIEFKYYSDTNEDVLLSVGYTSKGSTSIRKWRVDGYFKVPSSLIKDSTIDEIVFNNSSRNSKFLLFKRNGAIVEKIMLAFGLKKSNKKDN